MRPCLFFLPAPPTDCELDSYLIAFRSALCSAGTMTKYQGLGTELRQNQMMLVRPRFPLKQIVY